MNNTNTTTTPADETLQNEPEIITPVAVIAPGGVVLVPEKKPYTGKPRGFAAMDRSKVSEIASKGGKSAHAAGTAHQFSSDEARLAGKKGGMAPHVSRGAQKKTTDGTV